VTAPQNRNSFAEPELPPIPVGRAKAPANRYLRPAVALLVVAVLGFGGGFAVAKATTPAAASARGNGQFGNGQFPGGLPGGATGARRNFGGGASGTVAAVSADQLTLTTAAGAQRLVLLTPTTTVTAVTSATKALSDIAAGATVTIVGSANTDGSVTATQVIIGSLGILGRGFGGSGDGGPNPAPVATP
jgi:pectate lyase